MSHCDPKQAKPEPPQPKPSVPLPIDSPSTPVPPAPLDPPPSPPICTDCRDAVSGDSLIPTDSEGNKQMFKQCIPAVAPTLPGQRCEMARPDVLVQRDDCKVRVNGGGSMWRGDRVWGINPSDYPPGTTFSCETVSEMISPHGRCDEACKPVQLFIQNVECAQPQPCWKYSLTPGKLSVICEEKAEEVPVPLATCNWIPTPGKPGTEGEDGWEVDMTDCRTYEQNGELVCEGSCYYRPRDAASNCEISAGDVRIGECSDPMARVPLSSNSCRSTRCL